MSETRSLNTTRKKKPTQAFYQPSSSQTSARIIEDARKSIRTLPTERPYTPAESGRILFGNGGSQSRPPSVYSIHARQFSASRPSTSQKLAPIEKTAANDIVKKVDKCIHVHGTCECTYTVMGAYEQCTYMSSKVLIHSLPIPLISLLI